jgi:transcriptional regulator with XRE-family HTH domain
MKARKKPIHPYLKKIGERIKHFRVEKGLSLEALGIAIGIDGANMQKIEKGANITLSTLIKIFVILEINPLQFFNELPWKLSGDDIEALTITRPIKKKGAKKKRKPIR